METKKSICLSSEIMREGWSKEEGKREDKVKNEYERRAEDVGEELEKRDE